MPPCLNCRERNPKYRSACFRCNAPLSSAERERRERRRTLNELREANGKDPLPAETTDETVEPVDHSGLTRADVAMGAVILVVLASAVALSMGWL